MIYNSLKNNKLTNNEIVARKALLHIHME